MTTDCFSAKINNALHVKGWLLKFILIVLLQSRYTLGKPNGFFFDQYRQNGFGLLKRIIRSGSSSVSDTETRMIISEIENTGSGLKWSAKNTRSLMQILTVNDIKQHKWIVCQRANVVMLGLRLKKNNRIRFAVKLRNDLLLSHRNFSGCAINPNTTDIRYFRVENFDNENYLLLKHIESNKYLQVNRTTKEINFTIREHATPWLFHRIHEVA